jgi:uncharacterized alpha-E superfamily protein
LAKTKTISQEAESVAVLLQKLVRLKAADLHGFCVCVTCEAKKHWKEMQGGHFIERGKLSTKLLEENIHSQCASCNHWGMKRASTVLSYRRYMVEMYGQKFVNNLEKEAKQIKKFTRSELEQMKADFKEQIKYQLKRIGE